MERRISHDQEHLQIKETNITKYRCMGSSTVEPVYYGHHGTSQKCPDYQIFQVSLHANVSFGTTAMCVDYAGVHIFNSSVLINRFHCNKF